MQLTLQQIIIPPGHQLLLQQIDWQTFEQLLDELGNTRSTRLSYSDKMVEIMSPMAAHEDEKSIISDLVKTILEELDIEFRTLGSTTFKNAQMELAVEPDECFYIQHERHIRGKNRIDLLQDPPPDLAIEIDLTSRTHFHNYERLGVPELWRYDGKQLYINVLENGYYVNATTSRQFPMFAVQRVIPYYVIKSKEIGRNKVMKAFRALVKECLV